MSQGVDVSGLFSEIVKACATVDIVQKKLVYVFLCSYATLNPELSLLVINTLRKDCQDRSKSYGPQPSPEEHDQPQVRRGSTVTLEETLYIQITKESLIVLDRLPSLVEYVEQPLTAGLRDRAACVRRVAVLGWAKLHNLQPNSEIGNILILKLY